MVAEKPQTRPLGGAVIALCAREPEELAPVEALLKEMGSDVHAAESVDELDELLEQEKVDVVLLHICPSRQEFLDVLDRKMVPPMVPLLCHTDRHLYMETLRRGAFDCVPLPIHKGELERVLTLALAQRRQKRASAA
jgi:DNA-binding NtrC family response regulator